MERIMQVGFYFDQTRCTGCSSCRVACKDWNDIPAGPENWMNIHYSEKGKCPQVFVSYTVAVCWHCVDPVCIPACPEDAISKREQDGIVLVDRDACIGNEKCDAKCLKACPYDAPQLVRKKEPGWENAISVLIAGRQASCRIAWKPAR
jgi:anaerobic dimethyl sulfoxide reductase subunit B (iron-sulfur subunit)